jgi:hypothetical protein
MVSLGKNSRKSVQKGELPAGYITICAGATVETYDLIKNKAIGKYGADGVMLGVQLLVPCLPQELLKANQEYQKLRGFKPAQGSATDSTPAQKSEPTL